MSGVENITKTIIPSSGKSNKSDAEFTSEIKGLAQKAAAASNITESKYISR